MVHNPSEMPQPGTYDHVEEPVVRATVITPSEYLGPVLELCQARRGELLDMQYLSPERAEVHYKLPLAEIIFDFFDQLKSKTRGYASLDYEPIGYEPADLVRVDILLHGEPVDAFSSVVHREKAAPYGRQMVERLRELIPRQLFDVAIQASIGSRIVARETVKAKRKDVLAKCYGGDITRKRKLLEQQKRGQGADAQGRPRRRAAGGVHRGAPRRPEGGGEEVTAGVYVHVPFCLTRCGYCDFNAYAGLDHLASRYVSALLREAELAAPAWADDEVASVFLGGGTPTTLEVADLKALLVRLRHDYAVGARRRGHDRGQPRHGRPAEARRVARGGVRAAVDGGAVVRPAGARRRSNACTTRRPSAERCARRARPATRT